MKNDKTYLGVVRRVVGATVTVEISSDVPSANPIIGGRSYRLGQLGTFVRIPLGALDLFGVVAMIGATEAGERPGPGGGPVVAQRWLEVQLIGESYSSESFQRGVSLFPTLDDEVHIVTDEHLSLIYGAETPSMIEVGALAASESLRARIDLDKVVTRHAAVVGSTGSGKSNSIAVLLKRIGSSFPSASVVVIDPHGEYGSALKEQSEIFSIGHKTHPLIIPYWALSFDELAWFLVDRKSASETLQDSSLRDYIVDLKRQNAASLKAGKVQPDQITADSPIPFSIPASVVPL